MHINKAFFPKSGQFFCKIRVHFFYFKKGYGRPPSPSPLLIAPLNSSPSGRNECYDVYLNRIICKASVTHFNEYAVNVRCKVFRVVLTTVSVNTVSVPAFNVVKVTITLSYQCKSVLSTSHANTSPA